MDNRALPLYETKEINALPFDVDILKMHTKNHRPECEKLAAISDNLFIYLR